MKYGFGIVASIITLAWILSGAILDVYVLFINPHGETTEFTIWFNRIFSPAAAIITFCIPCICGVGILLGLLILSCGFVVEGFLLLLKGIGYVISIPMMKK